VQEGLRVVSQPNESQLETVERTRRAIRRSGPDAGVEFTVALLPAFGAREWTIDIEKPRRP
jgi:hypothetical protein